MRIGYPAVPLLALIAMLSPATSRGGSPPRTVTPSAAPAAARGAEKMTTALLLIDIQNDYFPGGRMELVGSDAASAKARLLLEHFRAAKMPVVHVRHEAVDPGATFFLPGTAGAEIRAAVKPLPGETVITKHFPNAFLKTPLAERLRALGVKRLVVAGMMTHMCVDASVRAAADQDFECLLASDACATRDLKWAGKTVPAAAVQGAFLAALGGTYAEVKTAGEILAALGI